MSARDGADADLGLDEQLSMLWSDELAPDAAAALRARIDAEPDVAERWQRFQAAMDALGELPDAMAPPALRVAGVPMAAGRAPARSRGWAAAAVALAAAALALAAVRPWQQPGDVVLVSGVQWVEGAAELRAGDVQIEVDGAAWISVEPADGPARVGRAPDPEEELAMNRSVLFAGLAGSVVTVAVYEGTAVVRAATGAPVVVEAGQTHREPMSAPASGHRALPDSPEARQEYVASLQRELEDVQHALDEAQFAGALARGQLQAIEGVPSPWPDDVPEAISPARFRGELEAKLAEMPGVTVAEVDCAEYPCVASVQYTGPDDEDWNKPVGEAVRDWLVGAMGDGLSLSTNTSRFSDDNRDGKYVIFGAYSGDRTSDVGVRTDRRIDAMVDAMGEQFKAEGEASEGEAGGPE